MNISGYRQVMSCIALAGTALLAPASAHAQLTLIPGGSWEMFTTILGSTAEDNDLWFGGPLTISAGQSIRVFVTDADVTGDAFDIWVNGSLLSSTPSVSSGVFTDAIDGNTAWADGRLSKASFTLGPGAYTLGFVLRESDFGYADGFVRAEVIQAQVVPEPGMLGLMGLGLLGVALLGIRRTGVPRS